MVKQLEDGRIDLSDALSYEEIELMQHWHGGQWCPLYALQSSGTLYREDLGRAIGELERNIKHMDCEEVYTAQGLIKTLEDASNKFPLPDED